MTTSYRSTNPLRTLTAVALAVVLSTTCLMAAVAPAAVQSAQSAGMVAQPPIA